MPRFSHHPMPFLQARILIAYQMGILSDIWYGIWQEGSDEETIPKRFIQVGSKSTKKRKKQKWKPMEMKTVKMKRNWDEVKKNKTN